MIVKTRDAPLTYFDVGFAFSKMVDPTTAAESPSFSQSSSSAVVAGSPLQGSSVTSSVMFDLVFSVVVLVILRYYFSSFLCITIVLSGNFRVFIRTRTVTPSIRPSGRSNQGGSSGR